MTWRVATSIVLLLAMSAWGAWLLTHAKSKEDYVVARAATTPRLALCEWVPMTSPSISNLGLSQDSDHAWTDRAEAYIAFPIPAIPDGAWLEFEIAAVAKGEVLVDVDGGQRRYAVRHGGRVRVPVPASSGPRVLLVTFIAKDLLPPNGSERRWLGAAVSGMQICNGQ